MQSDVRPLSPNARRALRGKLKKRQRYTVYEPPERGDAEAVIGYVSAIEWISASSRSESQPWLVRGVLHKAGRRPILRSLVVEHFTNPDAEVSGWVLRGIPVAQIRDEALRWAVNRGDYIEVLGAGWAVSGEDMARARRIADEAAETPLARGPKGYGAEHYRRIAFRYLELLREGRRDVLVALAEEESERLGREVRRETVRDWVKKATRLGFLAPGTPGRAEERVGPNLGRTIEQEDTHG
jgi:hypothetical protein